MAHFDRLRFIPVPDPGTRVNGLRAGDYDYAESVPSDLFDELDADSGVDVVLNGGPIFGLVFMNSRAGPLQSNFKLRQAIQAALDKEDALRVSIGPEKLWRANGSFLPKGNAWYSDAGTERFSEGDAEKAKALAAEAGYDGTPIKFLVSTNYAFHYDQAVVFTRQLLERGHQRRDGGGRLGDAHQEARAARSVGSVLHPPRLRPGPDPHLGDERQLPGVVGDRGEAPACKAAFTATNDPVDRKATWGRIQSLIYTQVPTMKTGDVYTYNIASPKLAGIEATTLIWPHFWGVSK